MLARRRAPLSDWLIAWFLDEVENRLHEGLAKQYSNYEGNETFFKGKLVVARQIAENLVHQERSYVAYSQHDFSHRVNRALVAALNVLLSTGIAPSQTDRVKSLRERFPEEAAKAITSLDWSRIRLERQTVRYADALELAQLICSGQMPGLHAGSQETFALLFDMQVLFERFVGVMCRKALRQDQRKVLLQHGMPFWKSETHGGMRLKPDILIQGNEDSPPVVLDTKWKAFPSAQPSSQDLHQLYAYGRYANARNVALVYPGEASACALVAGAYVAPRHVDLNSSQVAKATYSPLHCNLAALPLLYNVKLSQRDWETRITENLRQIINNQTPGPASLPGHILAHGSAKAEPPCL